MTNRAARAEGPGGRRSFTLSARSAVASQEGKGGGVRRRALSNTTSKHVKKGDRYPFLLSNKRPRSMGGLLSDGSGTKTGEKVLQKSLRSSLCGCLKESNSGLAVWYVLGQCGALILEIVPKVGPEEVGQDEVGWRV